MWETTRHRISRRKLLRGIGAGSFLLTPFVRNRLADAAPQGNFFFFATPNGFVRDKFGGQGTGAAWTLKESLKNLEPFKNDVTIIRGLCNKTSSTFNSHEDMCKLLSMVHGGGDKYTVYAPSFDHDLAKVLGTTPLTLGVQPISPASDSYAQVSYVGAGKPDPKLTVPLHAYLEAFGGGVMPGAGADLLLKKRRSVLDFVDGDITRFQKRLVGKDAENLDLYLTAIRDIERKLGSGSLEVPAMTCDPSAAQASAIGADKTGVSEVIKFQAMGEAMMDIAATAFACGSRRIGTVVWQRDSGGINPLGSGPGHHGVSHGEAPVSVWAAIDHWYANRFVYFVNKMKTLGALDDTITVWGSGIAEEHNQNDMVFVVAGGRNTGVKLGQNISYPFYAKPVFQNAALQASRDVRHKSLADLWVSVQKALGHTKDTVGDAQWCSGGLQEFYAG